MGADHVAAVLATIDAWIRALPLNSDEREYSLHIAPAARRFLPVIRLAYVSVGWEIDERNLLAGVIGLRSPDGGTRLIISTLGSATRA